MPCLQARNAESASASRVMRDPVSKGRTLTDKGPGWNYVDLVASSKLKRISEIKVGDQINDR
jgi:hypothetical protein